MCLLIVLVGVDRDYPLVVASNRDEARTRLASPPGLFVGARRRMLSPRDRTHGGTWLAVSDRGLFAGLTNIAGLAPLPTATTRGAIPHLALDHEDLDTACAAVCAEVARQPYNAFQLVLSDGQRSVVIVHQATSTAAQEVAGAVLVLSNEHRLGQLTVPGVERALGGGLTIGARLEALRPILLDQGSDGRHRILKKGGAFGTVSSSLLAVPRTELRGLVWRYAAGPPDEAPYRDYGNLGRRLLEP